VGCGLALAVAPLIGCGSGSDATTTVSSDESDVAAEAAKAVNDYYDAIDSRAFGDAWLLLGSEQRREDQGFQTWRSGYATTQVTTLRRALPRLRDSDTAVVRVALKTVDEYSCDNRERKIFAGTWTVDVVGGSPVLSGADISQIGSVPLPSNCPSPPPPPPSPPPPPPQTTTQSNCDPSYPDACLIDGIGDYDCEGGSGNGPNYIHGPVTVTGSDPFGLDADGNGIGCESY
jgi:hypothetical protein